MAAIAYRVGFASQAHFTTIFRRWVGTTPRQYRQQRKRSPQPRHLELAGH